LLPLLLLAAAGSPFLFLHYGFAPYHCVYDYCTNERALWGKSVEFLGKPHTVKSLHTGRLIVVDGKPIVARPIYQGIKGVVIRDGIPTRVGWVGAIGAPLILLLATFVLALRKPKSN
jgi:hypothetical protein